MPLGSMKSSFPAFLKEDVILIPEHINFCIKVPADQSSWLIVNNAINKFTYDYFLEKVSLITETNNLVKCLLKFNDRIFPNRNFNIDVSTNKELNDPETNTDMKVYLMQQGYYTEYSFNLLLENAWTFQAYTINTHTSDQKLWILFLGYKVYRKKDNLHKYINNKKESD